MKTDLVKLLDAEHVRMKNKTAVIEKIKILSSDGKDKLQIIADYDSTITKHHHCGVLTPSSYGIFEAVPSVPKQFVENNNKLFKQYYPIENDPNMTVEEKLPLMEKWWRLKEELFPGIPYSEALLEQAVINCDVHLRDGTDEAFKALSQAGVPILVFSAGLGNVISAVLRHNNVLFDNLHVISNFFDVRNDAIVGFKGASVHVYNKNQHAIENSYYFKDLANRGNVIILGDSLGDINMDDGVQNKATVLKIGFLNLNIDEYLPQYLNHFDIVLIDDQTMGVFNSILDKILDGKCL